MTVFSMSALRMQVRPAGTRIVKIPLGEECIHGQTPEKRKRLFKWDPKELGPIPSWDNEWRQVATE
jgi:hypothetical protein